MEKARAKAAANQNVAPAAAVEAEQHSAWYQQKIKRLAEEQSSAAAV
jgi:hypothetical protein